MECGVDDYIVHYAPPIALGFVDGEERSLMRDQDRRIQLSGGILQALNNVTKCIVCEL